TVSPVGDSTEAERPVRFAWERYRPAAEWTVRFVALDSAGPHPVDPAQVTLALRDSARAALDTARLDLMWYRPPKPEIPQARVLTEAHATIALPQGRYRLRTIADDAVRVRVDGRLVLDDWMPGEARVRETVLPR